MLNKLFGNAAETDVASVQENLSDFFVEGEIVEGAYRVFRDLLVCTNKRLMLIDKQGVTGSKKSILSITYKSIKYFTIETAGTFEVDSELKIWISETSGPISKEFERGNAIIEVQKSLMRHIA
jgi:hypothetical protein